MKLFKRAGGCFQDVAQQRFKDAHYESHLEEWIYHNPQLIADDLMMIGRQVVTDGGKRIDLLAINKQGHTVIIELKRAESPRDLVGQINEYITAVGKWTERELERRLGYQRGTLEKKFRDRFECEPPDEFNKHRDAVVVVENIDPDTLETFRRQRIRVITFSYLKSVEEEYLLVNDLDGDVPNHAPIGKPGSNVGISSKGKRSRERGIGGYDEGTRSVLAGTAFPASDGWREYKSEDYFAFWAWRDAGFCTGVCERDELVADGVNVDEGDDCPRYIGVECETEAAAVRVTDVVRQHEKDFKTDLGDFVLSQDHKESDGSWNWECPLWTYVPGNVDSAVLVERMKSYRDVLSPYLDQMTPRLADELEAFHRYCEQAQPVLAREVFTRAEGWKPYTSETQRGFGFFLWPKAGFYTNLCPPEGITDFGLGLVEGDTFPAFVGVYCNTKGVASALTDLVRAKQEELRARLGDFVLSADHEESDGSWDYNTPLWTYVRDKEDVPALFKKMTAYRDVLTGYIDQITPRTDKK